VAGTFLDRVFTEDPNGNITKSVDAVIGALTGATCQGPRAETYGDNTLDQRTSYGNPQPGTASDTLVVCTARHLPAAVLHPHAPTCANVPADGEGYDANGT
jgi:hypothetical protein